MIGTKRSRNQAGVTALSVLAIWMLIGITVGVILFLMNMMSLFYYKNKLQFAGIQGVTYAANSLSWNGSRSSKLSQVEPEARELVDSLLNGMELPATSSFKLRVDPANNRKIILTFGVRQLHFAGRFASNLPFEMMQTSAYNLIATQPAAITDLRLPNGVTVKIPSYGLALVNLTNSPESARILSASGLLHTSRDFSAPEQITLGYPANWSLPQ